MADTEESEFEERAKLIERMLDKIYPFDTGMSQAIRDAVEADRQMIAMRAGWNYMPIEDLRRVASGKK